MMQATSPRADGAGQPGVAEPPAPRTTWLVAGGLVSAGLASACCLGPALLGLAGLGSFGAATVFEPYRPYLIGLAIGFLAAGVVRVHGRTRGPHACCASDPAAVAPQPLRRGAIVLWASTAVALLLIVYPFLTSALVRRTGDTRESLAVASRTITLSIRGMTCEACAIHVRNALLQDRSVIDARVSFAAGVAWVQVDPDAGDASRLAAAVRDRTSYEADVQTMR